MPDTTLRVGVAQIDCCLGALEQNLEQHLDLIARARDEGIELLVFPETSLTGYPYRVLDHPGGLTPRSAPLRRIAEAADAMAVVVGFVEEAPAAQYYNSCAVFAGKQLVHLHRKLNLATYGHLEEGKYFAQGRYVSTFDVEQRRGPDGADGGSGRWRASVLVCADAWNPALVHIAALHGTTLLIIPTYSADDVGSSEFSNPEGWELVVRFYAMIYGMPIIMANRVGTEGGLVFWGGSRVVNPFGETVVQAGREPELITADLDYDAVRRARVRLPTVRDSNLALVQREITRLEQVIGVPSAVRRL